MYNPLLFYNRVNARVLLESTNLVIASANNGAKLKCLIFPLSPFLKKGIFKQKCENPISTKKNKQRNSAQLLHCAFSYLNRLAGIVLETMTSSIAVFLLTDAHDVPLNKPWQTYTYTLLAPAFFNRSAARIMVVPVSIMSSINIQSFPLTLPSGDTNKQKSNQMQKNRC